MKRIQIKWLKTYNVIIGAILGTLGFTVSSCGTDYGTPLTEYGTPHADFIIQGKVMDRQTNQPIKDILVGQDWKNVSTDADGKYEIVAKLFPESQVIPIQFRDIDGDLNGSYMDLDTIVEFKDPQFTGGDKNWYKGKTIKEFNIQLNPKE